MKQVKYFESETRLMEHIESETLSLISSTLQCTQST